MVFVYHDSEVLSLAAAQLFADEARRAVEARGLFSVVLSGGETPRRTYELLAQEPLRRAVPWQDLHIFWGDERYVPHDDPLSNFGMARRALLDHVPVSESQVHPIPYGGIAAESAFEYEKLLRRHFEDHPLDLALLGLGKDGHTASLFPMTPALNETHRWVCDIHRGGQELDRVTVTPGFLNQSALAAFLVSGSGKAAMLQSVLEGDPDPEEVPARLINPPQGRLLWLVDREAAALLSQDTLNL